MMVRRPPIKLRLTLAFGTVTAVLFAGIGVGLYLSVASALLDEIDTGLAFRASTLQAQAEARLDAPGGDNPQLAEPGEALAQVVSADGTVLQASPSSRREPVLSADVLGRLDGPLLLERRVPGIANVTRLLAVPFEAQGRRVVVVVGASMQDRADTLRLVAGFVGAAEPLALLVACLAGWRLAGVALDPVERMRRQAAAVAVSGLDRRLSVPATDDEIARLARTLNEMLDRLERSFRTERHFLDTASHELRTPLAALRAELDLALARPRSPAETRAALVSASEETERLSRLAEDLLVLSRARQGRLPLRRGEASLHELVAGTVQRWRSAAAAAAVRMVVDAAEVPVHVDPMRMGQALDNLLDNAVRHCAADGVVTVTAQVVDGAVRILVTDDGPGFPDGARSGSGPDRAAGAGLGLGIVRAVAEAHGGGLELGNRPGGGGCAVLSLPAGPGG